MANLLQIFQNNVQFIIIFDTWAPITSKKNHKYTNVKVLFVHKQQFSEYVERSLLAMRQNKIRIWNDKRIPGKSFQKRKKQKMKHKYMHDDKQFLNFKLTHKNHKTKELFFRCERERKNVDDQTWAAAATTTSFDDDIAWT